MLQVIIPPLTSPEYLPVRIFHETPYGVTVTFAVEIRFDGQRYQFIGDSIRYAWDVTCGEVVEIMLTGDCRGR